MMSMKPLEAARLPQELIDEVIDHLRDDKSMLSNCSLVSHTWSPYARRLLFRSVHASPAKIPTTPHQGCPSVEVPDWSAFPRLFRSMPHLAMWVTEVYIKGTSAAIKHSVESFDEDESSGLSDDEDDWPSTNEKWHYTFPGIDTLYAVSQVFPKIRHMHLRNLVVKPGTCLPAHPIPLDTLTLKNVGVMLQGNVLWELFRLFCPRIEANINVFWRPSIERTVQEPPSAPPSTSFVARNWRLRGNPSVEYILCHLASTSFIHHAKSLDVALSDDIELQALVQLLKKSASTLKELKLDVREAFFSFDKDVLMMSDIGDAWDEHLDFSVCSALESLELAVQLGTTPRSATTIYDVSRALSTLPPGITRVRLVVDFPFFGPDLMTLPWGELNVLSCLPNLRMVELVLLKEAGIFPIDADVQKDLFEFFPHKIQSISHILQLHFPNS